MHKINVSPKTIEYREKMTFPISDEIISNTLKIAKTIIEEISEQEREELFPLFDSMTTINSLKSNIELFKTDIEMEKIAYKSLDDSFPIEHFLRPEVSTIYLSLKELHSTWLKPLKTGLEPIVQDIQKSKYLVNKISNDTFNSLFVDIQTYLLRNLIQFVENGYTFEDITQVLDLIKTRLIIIENYIETSRKRRPKATLSGAFKIYPLAEKIDRLLSQDNEGICIAKYE